MSKPLLQSYSETSATWNNSATNPKTLSLNCLAGDLLIAISASANTPSTMSTPTNDGAALTWNLIQSSVIGSHCPTYMWEAVVDTDRSPIVVTFTRSAGANQFGAAIFRFSGSDGVGASNIATGAADLPSRTLLTTQVNSAIAIISTDWNAVGPAATWNQINSIDPVNETFSFSSGQYTVYSCYYDDVDGINTYTTGMSAPTGQNWVLIALEIKGSSASFPPFSVNNIPLFAGEASPTTIRLRSYSSNQTFFQNMISTVVSITGSIQNQINKFLNSTAVTATATIQRQISKFLNSTSVSITASLQKQISKFLTSTAVSATASLITLKVFLRELISTAVSITGSMQRQINKILIASNVSITATIQKQISKFLTSTAVSITATLTPLKVLLRTLTATAVSITGTMQRQVGKILSGSSTVTATIQRQINKIISGSASITASIQKQINKTLISTATSITATLTTIKVFIKILTSTAVSITGSIQRQVRINLSTTISIIPVLLKQINKTLTSTAVTITATMTRIKVYIKILTATVSIIASLVTLKIATTILAINWRYLLWLKKRVVTFIYPGGKNLVLAPKVRSIIFLGGIMSLAFSSKKVSETVVVTFDLVNQLGLGETLSSATFSASYVSGTTDATPGNIISGASYITGTKVSQKITAGNNGTLYDIAASVNTSQGQILLPSAIMLVSNEL